MLFSFYDKILILVIFIFSLMYISMMIQLRDIELELMEMLKDGKRKTEKTKREN